MFEFGTTIDEKCTIRNPAIKIKFDLVCFINPINFFIRLEYKFSMISVNFSGKFAREMHVVEGSINKLLNILKEKSDSVMK